MQSGPGDHNNFGNELSLSPKTNLTATDDQMLGNLIRESPQIKSVNSESREDEIQQHELHLPVASESMVMGFDSPEKSTDCISEALSPRLPSSLVEVKRIARSKKKLGGILKGIKNFEESRWEEKEESEEISEEARKAWETGKKLGLLSKVSDEIMCSQIELLEKEDRARAKQLKKFSKKGEKSDYR